MKVLFIHDHIFNTYEDKVYSDKLSYDILMRYIKQFSHITIVARSKEIKNIPNIKESSGKDVNFVFLENISSISSYFGLRQKQKLILKSLISEYDYIIIRLPSEYGIMAANLAKEMNKKYLVEVVSCAFDSLWNYGNYKAKIYAPILYFKMKKAVYHASNVLYVTNNYLQIRYPTLSSKVISLSDVELTDDNDSILLNRINKINKKDKKDKVIFGTIGSMKTKYKGIHIALEMFSLLKVRFSNFEYQIVGDGNIKEYELLTRKLGLVDQVNFIGTLDSRNAVFNWLDTIDVYIQPSLTEGLPRTLIESISRGCPSIGSSVGGIPELLSQEMIFKSRNIRELLNIVENLIDDKDHQKNMAKINFTTSQKYKKTLLDKQRDIFYQKYIDFNKEVKNK